MRSLYFTYSLLFFSLLAGYSMPQASAKNPPADSVSAPSANALVADLARLIKEGAYHRGIGLEIRYDAYADTTMGCKLYVAQQIIAFGNADNRRWYYIDFLQPLKANQLKLIRARNGLFAIDASRRVTKKLKGRVGWSHHLEQGRNARLFIQFFASKHKRKGDFEQLHNQLSDLISQLVNYNTNNI